VFSGGCCVGVHLWARFPPTVWRPPNGRIQDRMARTHSAGVEATAAQATNPPPAPEPANSSASASQPSAETGAGVSIPEVEHTASGVFEVSLEGLRASTQDIEALRRIQALIRARPQQPNKSKKIGRLRPKHNCPSNRRSTDADSCR
jgi:hypothetical protein